jgi:hypothetical protein
MRTDFLLELPDVREDLGGILPDFERLPVLAENVAVVHPEHIVLSCRVQ